MTDIVIAFFRSSSHNATVKDFSKKYSNRSTSAKVITKKPAWVFYTTHGEEAIRLYPKATAVDKVKDSQ